MKNLKSNALAVSMIIVWAALFTFPLAANAITIPKKSILESVVISQYNAVVVFNEEGEQHRLYTTCNHSFNRDRNKASVNASVSALKTGSRIVLNINNKRQSCQILAIEKIS